MQRVKWHDGLSVGVDEIDGQHRALFKAVNAFLDSVESASNMDDVAVVITFLEEYLEVHFETEERAMIEHGYP
ncbi:MAG: hemerythrin, partial [Proteobacteria bacterium]|nr:hemerythrin [Pseudomonadota bacterium]